MGLGRPRAASAGPGQGRTEAARRRSVHLFGASLALTSLALGGGLLPLRVHLDARTVGIGLVLLALFALAESVVLHVDIGESAHSASLVEIPLVLGLFLLPPPLLIALRVLGAFVGLRFYRRQSASKLTFNLCMMTLEATVASLTFLALTGGPDGLAASSVLGAWGAAIVACLASTTIGSLAVLCVISLSTGRPEFADLRSLLAAGAFAALANASVAFLAVHSLHSDTTAAAPMLLLGAALAAAYRSHVRLRSRHTRLSSLYGFVRQVSTADDGTGIVRSVLAQTRDLLRAEVAGLVLVEDGEQHDGAVRYVRHTLDAGGHLSSSTSEARPQDWVIGRCLATGEPLLGNRGTRERSIREYLEHEGVRDCVLVPVPGDGRPAGTLFVGNRRSEHSTFDSADVLALEGAAGHAAVALRNGNLVDRLLHDSRHDGLTGLPNRFDFEQRLAGLLQDSDARLAVLFMDLDRFKDVNDTLGHHAGDALLQQVAQRLRGVLAPQCTIARLGGDEFAVVLPGYDGAQACAAADAVQAAVEQPVGVDGVSVDVGVSIGVALAPEHGTEAGLLMRRADIAMYDAKSRNATALYSAERDDSSTSRLALVAQLRAALAAEEFVLHFQPQVQARTGVVQGFEALIRWVSPTRGFVPPDEFIPVAERAGLLQEITGWVLQASLDAVVQWRRDGYDIGVAVNLSPRNLLDAGLPGRIRRMMRERDLPYDALTLEITEGTIMAEPERARETLVQLHATGVRLSIDDFGTGYSSLAYLKRLPVDEVKIDKSFIQSIADDDQDLAIVQSVVTLAGSMGLQVVAEGVEDEPSWDRLAAIGCDLIQGYHVSRPIPSDDVGRWLADYRAHRHGTRAVTAGPPSVMPLPRSVQA